MDCFLKKIIDGKLDDEVHGEFIKFSRGEFGNKYLIDAKKQKDKWSIKTGAEFANYLVKSCLCEVEGEVAIKGAIISTLDLKDKIGFEISDIKQFMGVKQLIIDTKIRPEVLIKIMNDFPRAFFALSFITPKSELKIKAKAPKSAKPAAGGDKEVKAEFCSLKTTDQGIVRGLIFDFEDFRELSIKHILKINDIELPKGESDPVKLRENAKRKGTIIRIANVDGKETKKEIPFIA